MQRRTLIITNRLGLHARAAAKVVKTAGGYTSDIQLARTDLPDKRADAKSIFGILLLAATRGTEIEVITDGTDEAEALGAVCKLIESKFDEA
jgi:phosphocarrier protein